MLDDLNAGRGEGLGYYRSSVRHGRRWSAADAFLRPALARGNVHLATHAMVQRIVKRMYEFLGAEYHWTRKYQAILDGIFGRSTSSKNFVMHFIMMRAAGGVSSS